MKALDEQRKAEQKEHEEKMAKEEERRKKEIAEMVKNQEEAIKRAQEEGSKQALEEAILQNRKEDEALKKQQEAEKNKSNFWIISADWSSLGFTYSNYGPYLSLEAAMEKQADWSSLCSRKIFHLYHNQSP